MLMAVFFLNNCKFHGCGLGFPTLADLIHHIEDSHIDGDPKHLEKQEVQQPSSLALSYILKHFASGSQKDLLQLPKKKPRFQAPALTIRSSTPTGSEFDDEDLVSDDEDSDDSWTTQEELTSELILGMMSNMKDGDGEKPFACPVPGCKKRYKNVNGIKYHARHGHRRETKVKKAFRCKCGKCYRTAQGLRSHMLLNHPSDNLKLQTVPHTQPHRLKSLPQVTNTILTLPTSVAQSFVNNNCPPSGLSLVPVSMVTKKPGEITLPVTATLQILSDVTALPVDKLLVTG